MGLDVIYTDLRYGLRILRKSPVFSTLAVLTLALGIGGNTAVFSLLDAAAFQTLPVPDPEQLVQVLLVWPSGARVSNLDHPEFGRLTRNLQSFAGTLTYTRRRVNFRSGDFSDRIRAQLVSGTYYSTLNVQARIGRTIRPEDDRPSASPVAVLSHAFWKRKFSEDPSVLGKTVYVDGSPFTIIGVTPQWFFGVDRLSPPDISIPLSTVPQPTSVQCLGRLKPGISRTQCPDHGGTGG